ncbi:TetR/AcrR family transcriptional regulator [Actinomadura montaniterrae]|uniref:TetR/AcrR family transcriptional regulator n=1 Tax=Actinomadura montaniterrae TaxID=1803903 RepID=A0A6L3VXF2_9ACTN|nr:TetR/AcrR family transcriptional regulator [Actinomadura montaniterrae]KAB2384832.1 TetR/AcrR family transcriptional regulator [Actinomadura montaniterrae]
MADRATGPETEAPQKPTSARGRRSAAGSDARGKSGTRRDLVEGRIIEEAERLFAEKGFAATSLQDIADAAGMTRPAIYHYVRSKDDLLARLVQELTWTSAEELRQVSSDAASSAVTRLHGMVKLLATRLTTHPERFQLMIRSEPELPAELASVYAQGRRNVLREFIGVIDEGVRDGSLRPVDTRAAALAIIGMCNWLAWWYKAGRDDPEKVTAQIADMAVASLQQPGDRRGEGEGPARALSLLRQDLDYLERLIND